MTEASERCRGLRGEPAWELSALPHDGAGRDAGRGGRMAGLKVYSSGIQACMLRPLAARLSASWNSCSCVDMLASCMAETALLGDFAATQSRLVGASHQGYAGHTNGCAVLVQQTASQQCAGHCRDSGSCFTHETPKAVPDLEDLRTARHKIVGVSIYAWLEGTICLLMGCLCYSQFLQPRFSHLHEALALIGLECGKRSSSVTIL